MYELKSGKWKRKRGRGSFDVYVEPPEPVENASFTLSIRGIYSVSEKLILYIDQDVTGDTYVYNDDIESDVPTYFEVSGTGGNYTVTYTLDNNPSESYTGQFTGETEIVWNVSSQSRVDGTDINGTDVTIVNSTDLPLNVVVTGDDLIDPRFNVVSTTGNVNVDQEIIF